MSEHVRSLERGLSVIRAFDADAPAQTLSEVARRTGLDRAAARRFLLTLVELGYVRTDGKLFTLTPLHAAAGTVVAAANVSTGRRDVDLVRDVLPALRACAAAIEADLQRTLAR